eukprot:c14568_g1_i1 orf=257-1054(-)
MENWRKTDIVDAVLAPAAIALLLAYHIFLFYKVRTRPMKTVMGLNLKARRLWVFDMLIENHKKNVLAVQTLRNSIMESTLMATTAILLTAGLATYFTFANNLKQLPGGNESGKVSSSPPFLSPSVSSFGSISSTIKSFAVLSCFMVSFLCHTQSIRYINHVNYMINIPLDHIITPEFVADLMERSTFMYGLGSRMFYIAFPLLLWVFGSVPMLICAMVLLHALYSSDFVQPDIDNCNVSNKVSQDQHSMELQNKGSFSPSQDFHL